MTHPDESWKDMGPEEIRKLVRWIFAQVRARSALARDPSRCATLLEHGQRCSAPLTEQESRIVDGERYCLTCFRRFLRTGVIEPRRDEQTGDLYYVVLR